MSTLAVQECNLWLNLGGMEDAEEAGFLSTHISQVGLLATLLKNLRSN